MKRFTLVSCITLLFSLPLLPQQGGMDKPVLPVAEEKDGSAQPDKAQPRQEQFDTEGQKVLTEGEAAEGEAAAGDERKGIGKAPAQPQLAVKRLEAAENPKREAKADNQVSGEVKSAAGGGLLLTEEGSYLIRRIPEITIPDKEGTAQKNIVALPENVQRTEPEEGGLFGMGKEKTETFAKIAIVALIFLVFIIFRMRAKTGGRTVVRRFPRK